VIIELYLVHPFLRTWYAGSEKPGRLAAVAVAVQVMYVFVHELALLRGPLSQDGAMWLCRASRS